MNSPAKRILVVDDDASILRLVENTLVNNGYEVVCAASGSDALDLAAKAKPDLILLDIMLPGMNGFAVCRTLRSVPGAPRIPVIFMTCLTDAGAQTEALAAGGDDFLSKPVDSRELLARIRVHSWFRQLRSRPEVKDDLVATVVHDLKNPLTCISGHAAVLKATGVKSQTASASIEQIFAGVAWMNRMIGNMLDISRSEHGALVARPAAINLGTMIDEVTAAQAPRLAKRGQRLLVEHDPRIGGITSDPDLLRRLLENLVDNAVRYSPSGGEVTIRTALAGPEQVHLSVQDAGRGIPDGLKARVFDRYFQVDASRDAARREGSGLGLTFCKLAAEALNGAIWIEDPPGGGCAVHVSIPCHYQAVTAATAS